MNGDSKCVQLLLNIKANANSKNKHRKTALRMAEDYGRTYYNGRKQVVMFLKCGA